MDMDMDMDMDNHGCELQWTATAVVTVEFILVGKAMRHNYSSYSSYSGYSRFSSCSRATVVQ